MLKQRLILGILLAAVLVGLIWLDTYASGGWPTASGSMPPGFMLVLVSLIIVPWGLWEMKGLLAREKVDISLWITITAAMLCMLWPWIEQVSESVQQQHDTGVVQVAPDTFATGPGVVAKLEASPWYAAGRWFRSVKPQYLVPTVLVLALLAAVVKYSRHKQVEGVMANAGGTLLAIVYMGVLPGFFLPICMTHTAWMVLAIVGVVKAADIGAYATGRTIGRHKLIPWLSPGKTIEGFVGGIVLSGIVGAGVAMAFRSAGQPASAAYIVGGISGVLLGATGQLGDLLESLLKRDAGVKDSGRVPGFGGVLDILDSPLLAAPVAYWLLKIIVRA